MANFVPFDREQAFLLPPDLKDWLRAAACSRRTQIRVLDVVAASPRRLSRHKALRQCAIGAQIAAKRDQHARRACNGEGCVASDDAAALATSSATMAIWATPFRV